jgi:hypothetical protein
VIRQVQNPKSVEKGCHEAPVFAFFGFT